MNYKDFQGKSAYEILDDFNLKEPPFNPFEIAYKLGIQVNSALDFDKLGSEGQIYVENNSPIIWINPLKSEGRRRFTLAHEIGHLVNDVLPDINNPIIDKYETLYRNSDFGGKETKANRFAAQLLMPLDSIQNFILELKKQKPKLSAKEAILAISDKFEVSKMAVFFRLKNLKLIAKDYKYPF